MKFDYKGRTYNSEREVFVVMYEETDSKGRTTRELAEEIMTGLDVKMKSKDSWNVKRLNDAIPPSTTAAM